MQSKSITCCVRHNTEFSVVQKSSPDLRRTARIEHASEFASLRLTRFFSAEMSSVRGLIAMEIWFERGGRGRRPKRPIPEDFLISMPSNQRRRTLEAMQRAPRTSTRARARNEPISRIQTSPGWAFLVRSREAPRNYAMWVCRLPAGRDLFEGFAAISENGGYAGCRLIAADDDVDVTRIALDAAAHPPGIMGSD
jgi:hypothetical protein